jgi:hypothetical protein
MKTKLGKYMFCEGEPVNRSQTDIKRKTCDIRPWGGGIYFSAYPPPTLIHLSHRFTSASQPTAQKPSDCCLRHLRISVSTSSSSAKRFPPKWNRFTRQTLPTINMKHFFMNIICIESICPYTQNTQADSALRYNTPRALSPFRLLKPASE